MKMETLQVLDIAPSDATKAFSRALEEKNGGVELKLTEKDLWNKKDPVIFICNYSSRIKSDISPIMNFIGDNTSKILLLIFHCKTLKRLPVISLKEELKNELPANIEIIEMGFDIHSKSNGIYNCDLNTKSCRRIEDYASENNVFFKDSTCKPPIECQRAPFIDKMKNLPFIGGVVRKLFPNATDKAVTGTEFEKGMANTDSNLDTLQKNKADSDDNIDKSSADILAKDVPEKLREEMTAENIVNNQNDLVEVNASTENQRVDMPVKEASVGKPDANTTGNDDVTVTQRGDMASTNISIIEKQHADMPGHDVTYEKGYVDMTATDNSNKRQRLDVTVPDDTIEKQPGDMKATHASDKKGENGKLL